MRPGIRFGLSAIEKGEVWSRWKAGESLHEIGRAFDKPHSCIRAVLLLRGGIPPAARRRSRLALTFAEREDISRGIAAGSSIREIRSRISVSDARSKLLEDDSFVSVEQDTVFDMPADGSGEHYLFKVSALFD